MTLSKFYERHKLWQYQYVDLKVLKDTYCLRDTLTSTLKADSFQLFKLTRDTSFSGYNTETFIVGESLKVIRLLKDVEWSITSTHRFDQDVIVDLNGFELKVSSSLQGSPAIHCSRSLMFYGMKKGSRLDLNCRNGLMMTSKVTDLATALYESYPLRLVQDSTYIAQGEKITSDPTLPVFATSPRISPGHRRYSPSTSHSYTFYENPDYCRPLDDDRSFYFIGGRLTQDLNDDTQDLNIQYVLYGTTLRNLEIRYADVFVRTPAWYHYGIMAYFTVNAVVADSKFRFQNTSTTINPDYASQTEEYNKYHCVSYGLYFKNYSSGKLILEGLDIKFTCVRGFIQGIYATAQITKEGHDSYVIADSLRIVMDMTYDWKGAHPVNAGYAMDFSGRKSVIVNCDLLGCAGGVRGSRSRYDELFIVNTRSRSWYSGHGGVYTSTTDSMTWLLDCELGLRNSKTYYSGAAGGSYLGYDSYVKGDNVTFSNYHKGNVVAFVLNWRGRRGNRSYLSNVKAVGYNGGTMNTVRVDAISDLYLGQGSLTFSDGVVYTPDLVGTRGTDKNNNIYFTNEVYRPEEMPRLYIEDSMYRYEDSLAYQRDKLQSILEEAGVTCTDDDTLESLVGKVSDYLSTS